MLDYPALMELLKQDADPAVTIAMPTHRTMPEAQQNSIRFKNLLNRAREALEAHGGDDAARSTFAEKAGEMIDDYDFWQHQEDGLAVFWGPDVWRVEKVDVALPELVHVGQGFAIKPFLPLLKSRDPYYVLAAAWENVRLYNGDGNGLGRMRDTDVPETIKQLEGRTEIDGSIHFHPSGPTPTTRGEPTAKYHSLGTAPPEEKEKIQNAFARDLAKVADDLLRQNQKAALVLIADERLSGMFASHAKGDVIRSPGTQVSPADLSREELHSIAEDALRAARGGGPEGELDRFYAHFKDAGSEQASATIEDIAEAALMGRVADLFVDPTRDIPGAVDPATGKVVDEKGGGDLIDAIARLTLTNGGQIHVVSDKELPDEAALAALYRY